MNQLVHVLRFTKEDVDQFATLSGDVNPLHMDSLYARRTPYGQRVVFGALGVLKCLENLSFSDSLHLKTIKVEFHNAIFIDVDYEVSVQVVSGSTAHIKLTDNSRTLLKIDLERSDNVSECNPGSCFSQVDYLEFPDDLSKDAIEVGRIFEGTYAVKPRVAIDIPMAMDEDNKITQDIESVGVKLAARGYWFKPQFEQSIIMLTSYLVGMRAPGVQALFSKMEINFEQRLTPDSSFDYTLKIDKYEKEIGLLFLELNVFTPEKGVVARASLQSFVRASLNLPTLEQVSYYLNLDNKKLHGKTALIIGGSRGLGATLVQSLVLSGVHVYLNFSQSLSEAIKLKESLQQYESNITFLQGDAADYDFCVEINAKILREKEAIDIVICNACASPQPMQISNGSRNKIDNYIHDNFKLVSNPLNVFVDALEKNNGTFVAISSIYVETGAKDFPQYVALKNLVESLVKSASLSYKNVSFIIPRPPKLLTDMSNTPIGSFGAIAPEIVGARIISTIPVFFENKENFHIINNFLDNDIGFKKSLSSQVLSKKENLSLDTSVYIAASFSADIVISSLSFFNEKLSLAVNPIMAPYNQIFQQLLSPDSLFRKNTNGYNFILLRFEDALPYDGRSTRYETLDKFESLKEIVSKYIDDFLNTLLSFKNNSTSKITVVLCPSLEVVEDFLDINNYFSTLADVLAKKLAVIDGVGFIDACNLQLNDATQVRDRLRYEIGHIPFSDAYFHLLGMSLARNIFASRITPFKVIVLDCDNTLWSGVCDEVTSLDQIKIDSNFQVFQEFLISKQEQGVLLCLCSKNRDQAVWDVFDSHPDMKLKRSHIVDYRINWEPKSDNIKSLARSLNLGLDSFIFIDDNPVECAEVKSACAQVLTLQLPKVSSELPAFINNLWVLDKQHVTNEDKSRTRLYQENIQRQDLQKNSFSFADFIKDLDLQVIFDDLNADNLTRAAQLTSRTNQFNLSTKRRSEGEINALLVATFNGFTISVKDKFGDYGIVGLVLLEVKENTLVVDTFLLSCRVLGKGVEHQIAVHIAQYAQAHDIETISFVYVKSQKNHPIRIFLQYISDQIGNKDIIGNDVNSFSLDVKSKSLQSLYFDIEQLREDEDLVDEKPFIENNHSVSSIVISKIIDDIAIFSDVNALCKAIGSDHADVNNGVRLNQRNDIENVINNVRSIFSNVLDIPVNSVDIDSDMDVLVNESYKIVDLTVALKNIYPDIPQTLLFEAKNIKHIADFIVPDEHVSKNSIENFSDLVSADAPIALAGNNDPDDGKIAIIGMNGVFPGAEDIDAFWDNLKNGVCSIDDIPVSRWDVDQFFNSAEGQADKSYSKKGGFLKDAFKFDEQFFSISPREAETMDPQQRLFLQNIWGLMEDAGYTRASIDRDTGVFVGVISSDYALDAYDAALDGWSHYRMSDYYQIPNRVSYYFDLHGPSLAIDSACSSSASALHLACNSLINRECKYAIVGGVNIISHPSRFIHYSQMQMISKSGICSPFSDRADGTLFGEGVCSLLLKPLAQAKKDGDNIHGVILSTAINSGGKTNGFTVPNPSAHARLISNALNQKNIDPRSITYIEAHGTATNLGDPIEIRGLSEAFKKSSTNYAEIADHLIDEKWCSIGSVKSNIGHLESCAAIAGVIKCVMQMKHETIVPSLTNGSLSGQDIKPAPANSRISFSETPFKLQYELTDWHRPEFSYQHQAHKNIYPRRAGVSSFGAGGSNSHIIIEESDRSLTSGDNEDFKIIILSAKSDEQLASAIKKLYRFVVNTSHINIEEIAYTLQMGREDFDYRIAIVAKNITDIKTAIEAWLDNKSSPYLFTHKAGTLQADISTSHLLPLSVRSLVDATAWINYWFNHKAAPWSGLYKDKIVRKISLPKTTFTGRDYRVPKKESSKKNQTTENIKIENAFLGNNVSSPFIDGYVYQSYFDLFNLPYLTDHRIYGQVVVPGSMYVAYVLSALEHQLNKGSFTLSNLTFIQALLPQEQASQKIQLELKPADGGNFHLSLMSHHAGGNWIKNFTGQFLADSASLQKAEAPLRFNDGAVREQLSEVMDPADFYRNSVSIGFHWGPDFQCIKELYRKDGEALGLITLPESLLSNNSAYYIHPAFLDACFQVFVPGMSANSEQRKTMQAYLPLGVDQVTFYRRCPTSVWSHVKTVQDTNRDSLTIDITLYSLDGDVVAYFKGMNVLRASQEALQSLTSQSHVKDWLYTFDWVSKDLQNPGNVLAANRDKLMIFTGWNSEAIANNLTDVINSTETFATHLPDEQLSNLSIKNIQDFFETTIKENGSREVSIFYSVNSILKAAQDSSINLLNELQGNCVAIQRVLSAINGVELRNVALKFYMVSHEAYSAVIENKPLSLDSCLWNLGHVIALEYPQYWGGMIDLMTTMVPQDWKRFLLLLDDHTEDHWLLREKAYVARLATKPLQANKANPIKDDATYLITGAFGSLGKKVVNKIVAQGAKSLILMGRKTPDSYNLQWLDELKGQGVDVTVSNIPLDDQAAVLKLFQEMRERHVNLKGIIHLAGALNDGAFVNLDWARFIPVLNPKVSGSWNLHLATLDMQLDFFMLFSSASSVLGAPGQANYALANGFMDALATYRQHLGLPAQSINWGPWAGAGMAAEQQQSRKIWTNESFGSIGENQGLAFMSALMSSPSAAQVAVLPYDWQALLKNYPVDVIPSTLKEISHKYNKNLLAPTADVVSNDISDEFVSLSLSPLEGKRKLIAYLKEQIRKILGFSESDDIDANRSFLDMGFDSLLAVSFRTKLSTSFKCYMPATLIFDYSNLKQLSDYLFDELNKKAVADNGGLSRVVEKPNALPVLHDNSSDLDPVLKEITNDLKLPLHEIDALIQNELDELERMLSE